MSEINFNEQDEQPNTTQVEETTVVEPETQERYLPVKSRPIINDYIPGFAEMRLPRVNVVQHIGSLQEQFTPGEVVYRQTTVLYAPETRGNKATSPGEGVILGLLPKRWAERVSGGRGRLANSPEEVRRMGGTTDWDEWKLKEKSGLAYFEPLAEFIMLFKQPEHLKGKADAAFPMPVDGERYALGIWAMKSTAYNNCAKHIFFDRSAGSTYEHGYPSVCYRFTTWLKKIPGPGDKSAWVPKFDVVGLTSDSFRKFAAEQIASAEGKGASDQGPTED